MRKINYYLNENKLTDKEESRFAARVKIKDTLYQNDIINIMATKNTTVSRQDIIVVMDLLTEVVRDELLSGNRIITDLFQASVSIKGGFATDSTDYDSNVHYVKPNFTASAKLRKDIVSKAGVSKVDPGQKVPKVSLVYDIRYGTYGPHYPIGGIIEVKGKNFTLDEELEILLVSDFSGESVGGVHLLKITPSSILCQLPDTLEAGEYTMIVVVGTGDGALRGTYKTMMSIS